LGRKLRDQREGQTTIGASGACRLYRNGSPTIVASDSGNENRQ